MVCYSEKLAIAKPTHSLASLSALFISCSSNDDTDPENVKSTIDKNIIGKWNVEYSRDLSPARYIETEEELIILQKYYKDSVFRIGWNYTNDTKITEYSGNFNWEKSSFPKTGLFSSEEIWIEIKNDNTIVVASAGSFKNISISYKIEDNYLKWKYDRGSITVFNKYSIKNGRLIMEIIKTENSPIFFYKLSEYSKITE